MGKNTGKDSKTSKTTAPAKAAGKCPHPECPGKFAHKEDEARSYDACDVCGYVDSSTIKDK